MSVHGPLLRDMACQEAMWSRAVAADSPTAEDAATAAASQANKEEFVQEFSTEGPQRLQSQQAALDALAGERARQYKATCEQVGLVPLDPKGKWLLGVDIPLSPLRQNKVLNKHRH